MLSGAIAALLSVHAVLSLVAGTIVGIFVGSLPGIGPAVGIGLLLPLTFVLKPADALLFYASLYQAAEYGGSITAIAVSTPGAPNSAAMILDGYTLNRKGFPGLAFSYSLWSAVFASYVGIIGVLLLARPLSSIALGLGPPDMVMLGVFAMMTVAVMSNDEPMKGLISAGVGLMLGTVGLDLLTNEPRYTFGLLQLENGLPLLPVLVGLFAIPEVIKLLVGGREHTEGFGAQTNRFRIWLSWPRFRAILPTISLGTILGFFLGLIPGLAGAIPPWVSYNVAKSVSKTPEKFGTGLPEGIAAPESTNAAVMHATLIPAFVLGIPGTPSSAVIIGAMTIAGLQPGPTFFQKQGTLFYEIFLGLLISTACLWLAGMATTRLWAKVMTIPPKMIGLGILLLCVLGAYAGRSSVFDVGIMAVFGLIGFFMHQANYSIPSLILGLIIGPTIENNLKRTLIVSHGSYLPLVAHPFDWLMIVAGIAMLVLGSRLRGLSKGAPDGAKGVEDDPMLAAGMSEE